MGYDGVRSPHTQYNVRVLLTLFMKNVHMKIPEISIHISQAKITASKQGMVECSIMTQRLEPAPVRKQDLSFVSAEYPDLFSETRYLATVWMPARNLPELKYIVVVMSKFQQRMAHSMPTSISYNFQAT